MHKSARTEAIVHCDPKKPEYLRIRGARHTPLPRILGRCLVGMLMARVHGRCGLRFGQLANLPIAAYEVATVR